MRLWGFVLRVSSLGFGFRASGCQAEDARVSGFILGF